MILDIGRSLRYYYLRLRRLRGGPQELALGMAVGVFAGCLPIIPFQTAVAVALALCFRSSKITAAIGTWVSNPLDWYFLYHYSYKIGASILGLPEHKELFSKILVSMDQTHSFLHIAEIILQMGSLFAFAFIIGGALIGLVASPTAYFIFLFIFKKASRARARRKTPVRFGHLPE